jgi:hypothetical protein
VVLGVVEGLEREASVKREVVRGEVGVEASVKREVVGDEVEVETAVELEVAADGTKVEGSKCPQSACSVAVQFSCAATTFCPAAIQLLYSCSQRNVGIVCVYAARSGDELFDAHIQTKLREVVSHVFSLVEPLHSTPQVANSPAHHADRVLGSIELGSIVDCPAVVESSKVIASAIKLVISTSSMLSAFSTTNCKRQ